MKNLKKTVNSNENLGGKMDRFDVIKSYFIRFNEEFRLGFSWNSGYATYNSKTWSWEAETDYIKEKNLLQIEEYEGKYYIWVQKTRYLKDLDLYDIDIDEQFVK